MSGAPPPEISATRVRQGRRSGRIVWVLLISVVLVSLAFAVIWASHAGSFRAAQHRSTPTTHAAATFHTPTPAQTQP